MSLWGGRFEEAPDELLWHYTVDTSDRRMLLDDLTGSLAHVTMLEHVGIVSDDDGQALRGGLEQIMDESRDGDFSFLDSDEDVHSAVERRLGELIGEVAGKLHTARSRNDQVALDLRLYMRRTAADRIGQLESFVLSLVDAAESVGETVVATYTHMQQGQAVPLAHHLLAYAWMLLRDRSRFDDVLRRLDESPLGAGAGGGTSLPIDPAISASLLGFETVFNNSIDAVASRDLVAEYVFVAAQASVTLSRLAEDMLLWATSEYGWATYLDRHTTGSSAMPQKKNPDMAELARGRAATLVGDVTAILTLQKGLPMAYNRDLQEDKRLLFHADDTLAGTLSALQAMIAGAEFDPPEPSSWVGALDLAEALTARGVPFREAHHVVGKAVVRLSAAGRTLADADMALLQAVDARFQPDDLARVVPEESVRQRTSHGGGSHDSVASQIAGIREILA
ncbi:MAG: argininosuccinate lyase [Acidimicrobiia bacterium]|nr:argininosuccinate lyase [Acidimicrobiia bacterium]